MREARRLEERNEKHWGTARNNEELQRARGTARNYEEL